MSTLQSPGREEEEGKGHLFPRTGMIFTCIQIAKTLSHSQTLRSQEDSETEAVAGQ